MEAMTVIKSLFVLLVILSNSCTQAQKSNAVFIEVTISDKINLSENYCEKKVTENEVIFSVGLETLGEVNKFVYSKKDGAIQSISLEKYESLNISSIKELNKILRRKNKLSEPNSVFESVFIVEREKDDIKIYKVHWDKKLYLE